MRSMNEQLNVAAEAGDAAQVKTLLLDPTCAPLSKNAAGMTALMWAAAYGHDSCVQLLLPMSDSLAKSNNGKTVLMYAVSRGHISCVQILLPVSDILAKNKNKQTVSEIATENGHASLAIFIDAYLAQDEKLALDSFIPTGASQKKKSLRV